jgi:hypothetical protein
MSLAQAVRLMGVATILVAAAEVAAQSPLSLFRTEVQAQQHCPNDSVVWLDFKKRIYYLQGQRLYGAGSNGTYVCRQQARRNGYRRSLLGLR